MTTIMCGCGQENKTPNLTTSTVMFIVQWKSLKVQFIIINSPRVRFYNSLSLKKKND